MLAKCLLFPLRLGFHAVPSSWIFFFSDLHFYSILFWYNCRFKEKSQRSAENFCRPTTVVSFIFKSYITKVHLSKLRHRYITVNWTPESSPGYHTAFRCHVSPGSSGLRVAQSFLALYDHGFKEWVLDFFLRVEVEQSIPILLFPECFEPIDKSREHWSKEVNRVLSSEGAHLPWRRPFEKTPRADRFCISVEGRMEICGQNGEALGKTLMYLW